MIRKAVIPLLFIMHALGCGSASNEPTTSASSQSAQVTGTIEYRERLLLKPNAILEVQLLQTSPADAPAKTLATQTISAPPAPPIAFTLEYDPSAIDERLSYSVRATITQGDRLILTSDTHNPVLTRGAGSTAKVMLVAPAAPASKPLNDTKPDSPLTNTYWKLTSLNSEPYQHSSKHREPYIQLGKQAGAVNGFSGCNNFTGSFELNDDNISLQLAATQRACMEGMDTEQALLQALNKVNRYEIAGDSLVLLDNDSTLLEFEAVYF